MVTVVVLHLPRSGPVQWLKDRQWSPVSGGVNGGGGKVVVWFILAVRGSIVDLEHNKATSYLTGLGPAPRSSVHLSWVQKILQASQRIWSDELRRNRQAKELAVASFPAEKQEWSDVTRVLTEGWNKHVTSLLVVYMSWVSSATNWDDQHTMGEHTPAYVTSFSKGRCWHLAVKWVNCSKGSLQVSSPFQLLALIVTLGLIDTLVRWLLALVTHWTSVLQFSCIKKVIRLLFIPPWQQEK